MLYTVIYESLNLIPLIEQPWPDTLKLSISDGVAKHFCRFKYFLYSRCLRILKLTKQIKHQYSQVNMPPKIPALQYISLPNKIIITCIYSFTRF